MLLAAVAEKFHSDLLTTVLSLSAVTKSTMISYRLLSTLCLEFYCKGGRGFISRFAIFHGSEGSLCAFFCYSLIYVGDGGW